MRYCRDCKHYQFKEFDPFNKECVVGHSTPDGGYTEACPDYEEQWTIGMKTKYCTECKHYDFDSCTKGIEIPESGHTCDEFEEK